MATEPTPMQRVIIYGGITGWIGQKMAELLKEEGQCNVLCNRRFLHEFQSNRWAI